MNAYQTLAAATYAGGEFKYVQTVEEAGGVGDTLFHFLLIELSDKEGCNTQDEACCRIRTAIRQLSDVIDVLEGVKPNDRNFSQTA